MIKNKLIIIKNHKKLNSKVITILALNYYLYNVVITRARSLMCIYYETILNILI